VLTTAQGVLDRRLPGIRPGHSLTLLTLHGANVAPGRPGGPHPARQARVLDGPEKLLVERTLKP
jgi:hypothetical protein